MIKKYYYNLTLLVFSFLLIGCNDDLGTIIIEKVQEKETSITIAGVGTFIIKQNYVLDPAPTNVKTELKIFPEINTPADAYVLIGFDDTSKTHDNINLIKTGFFSEAQNEFQLLDTLGGRLFSEENLIIYPIKSGSTNISGYYTGICELISMDQNNNSSTINFNIIGVINHIDQIDFYPIESTIEFDRFTASYGNIDATNSAIRLLSGTIFKNDTLVGSLQNTDDETYSFTDEELTDEISATIYNINKKIRLTLTKN